MSPVSSNLTCSSTMKLEILASCDVDDEEHAQALMTDVLELVRDALKDSGDRDRPWLLTVNLWDE